MGRQERKHPCTIAFGIAGLLMLVCFGFTVTGKIPDRDGKFKAASLGGGLTLLGASLFMSALERKIGPL